MALGLRLALALQRRMMTALLPICSAQTVFEDSAFGFIGCSYMLYSSTRQ
jgi:hypothetical protein